jgi:nitroimidazol reductase NimA-like FMN-containing flavoprotein (pyridoxamine 5'-phosphate oxidase superfamily)
LFPGPGDGTHGILRCMDPNDSTLKHLSRDECLRLMASVPVGRVIYTRQALPAVELVNFALDDGNIVIRADRSGKLAAATRGAVVAFEADSLDSVGHSGWSVTVVGQSSEVTDAGEISRLERLGLRSWAPGEHEHFIRISLGILNGRALSALTPS